MKFNNSKLIENKPCKRYCLLLINLKLKLKKKIFFYKINEGDINVLRIKSKVWIF